MQTMIKNASRYDWATWGIGCMRAGVSGGAGAIGAPLGPMISDPGDFNLASGIHKVLFSTGVGFLFGAITGMAIFLKTHGAPDPIVQAALADAASASIQVTAAIHDAQDAVVNAKEPK